MESENWQSKVTSNEGFDQGDFIVVDDVYKDHLQVFNSYGEWVGAANFDGTKNYLRTKQGKKELRKTLW